MSTEMLLSLLIATVTALIGWWSKNQQDEIRELRRRSELYMLKEDALRASSEQREMLKEIKGQLERINDKLDRKADKP